MKLNFDILWSAVPLAVAITLMVAAKAGASGYPVPAYGGSCPYHTAKTSNVCVPNGDHQVFYLGDASGGCPLGWTSDGNYCVK